MIAGAESTIAGAELSIGGGGGEGHPQSIQIDTTVPTQNPIHGNQISETDRTRSCVICDRMSQVSHDLIF